MNGRGDFIDRVVIGPTPNQQLAQEVADCFFKKLDMNVEVACSQIPYRDW